jgi:phage repressor protein C with HTH and peptisase S24 domain
MKSTSEENQASELETSNTDQLSDRIKAIQGNDSVSVFAKKCGFRESTLRGYLSGSIPSIDKADQIAKAAGVNLQWLVSGEGRKTADEAANGEMSEFALIPGYNIQISAGNGLESGQEEITRKLAFRHKWLKFKGLKEKDLVLVFVKGDSMEPTISDNNTLMIDTSQQALEDGHIYVIRTNDHLVVKRIQNTLEGFILISDNKEYEKVMITYSKAEDLQVIGKVVWLGKDL